MNKVILIGNLTRDPETLPTQTGKTMVKFTIAVNRGDTADFFECIAFDRAADVVIQYCAKGRKIGISGYLANRSYDKNGEKRTYTQIVATEIEFFSPREDKAERAEKPKVVAVQGELPF